MIKTTKNLKDLTKEKILTERLLLIPVSSKYAGQMYRELTDEITEYLSIYSPKSIKDELIYIKDSLRGMKKGANLSLMILDRNTKEFLGNVGLKNLDTKTPEIGVWIKKSCHGKKIGREAVTALKEWADKNIDYEYIVYTARKDNIPSIKIAESLGGVFIKSGSRTFPSGKVHNSNFYHIPHK